MTQQETLNRLVNLASKRRGQKSYKDFAPSWVYELDEDEILELVDSLSDDPRVYSAIFPKEWKIEHYREWRDSRPVNADCH